MPRHSSNFQETPVQNALPAVQALADAVEPLAWLRVQTAAPVCAANAAALALAWPLEGTPALHGGLLQALTLAVAEHLELRLRHDGTLYRDGAPAGRVTLELIAQDGASLARITAPFADGLAAVLFALLAEWNARPYLPVANRWTAFALDGDIDQKGRRITIRDGKPVFMD
jgi:hypothetical protein